MAPFLASEKDASFICFLANPFDRVCCCDSLSFFYLLSLNVDIRGHCAEGGRVCEDREGEKEAGGANQEGGRAEGTAAKREAETDE